MKKTILSLLVALMAMTGAWAQSPATSGITWNASTNSGTFTMPAYDVEVNTELWYILKQNGETPVGNKMKANVFLDRTLQAKVGDVDAWNTFCAPFNAAIPSGWTVKELSSTSFSAGTLTLNFTNATSIVAGTPYLVQVDAEVVDPTFENVTQDWTTEGKSVTPAENGGYVTFVPVLTPLELNYDNTKLYLGGARTLYYPSQEMTIKGFRAYFQLNNGLTAGDPQNGARAFVLNLGDGEQTGVTDNKRETINNNRWFTVDGVRVEGQPTRKGVYIKNGRKVVIK